MASGPVQIAPGVWWVGATLPDDTFQCHSYLVDCGDQSVLIDPGSPLTLDGMMLKVREVMDPASIRWLVCHHADPDVAAALAPLSTILTRADVEVVTEWRAAALLKHYGHRFGYYRIEDNDWSLDCHGRQLEFQPTPYLHFPGAFVSYDTRTGTLFSSDLFGGFVPDSTVLVSSDAEYVIDAARPFHQHYMPSRALLQAGLGRIEQRWPDIARIAPQHGHVIDTPAVVPAFSALKEIHCGVFALADADLDLQRLLRIAEARTRLNDALLSVADLATLVSALDAIIVQTRFATGCGLSIETTPGVWETWLPGKEPTRGPAPHDSVEIDLPGTPPAHLVLLGLRDDQLADDGQQMLAEMAEHFRPAVDHHLLNREQERRLADMEQVSHTDSLTGLRNRRALEAEPPTGDYGLMLIDLDHFKRVNDTFGHLSGDVVLRQVAMAIQSCVRHGDRVFRVGGEEVLVVLPGDDEAALGKVAERTRVAIGAMDLAEHAPGGHVTLSIGTTSVRGGDSDAFDLAVAAADRALYRAKQGGRDRVVHDSGGGPG